MQAGELALVKSLTAFRPFPRTGGVVSAESFFWYCVDNSIMIEYLVLLSCAGFLAFLIPGPHRRYAAIAGWIFIVLTLFAMLPEFFREYNFMYPLIAAMSVPFLFITVKYLLAGDERVIHLSRAAAVSTSASASRWKFQITSTKLQTSSKHQIPNHKCFNHWNIRTFL